MTYQDAIDYLFQLEHFGVKWGLDNIRFLMAELGRPELKFKAIHVAGTNGKGSVCAYLTHILMAAGYRVGTYTSPHLVDFRERITRNGEPIPQDDLVRLVQTIRPLIDSQKATYFEAATAIGFCYFAEQDIDLAVVEVGLGGRLDATNVIQPLVSVITDISLEHTNVLGETLPLIAREKAGIIKPNIPVVASSPLSEVQDVFREVCRERGAPLYLVSENCSITNISLTGFGTLFDAAMGHERLYDVTAALIGSYQPMNAITAAYAVSHLPAEFTIATEHIRSGLANTRWPGRFQFLRKDPPVIADGAHNPAGLAAFVETYQCLFPEQKAIVLFAVLSKKDFLPMLSSAIPIMDRLILPGLSYYRRREPQEIAAELPPDFPVPVHIQTSTKEALDQLLAENQTLPIIIIGSLYLVGEALDYFTKKGS